MQFEPHELLGVEPDAPRERVRSRFRLLARRYHPDVNGGDRTAACVFRALKEAHDRLLETAAGNNRCGNAQAANARTHATRRAEPKTTQTASTSPDKSAERTVRIAEAVGIVFTSLLSGTVTAIMGQVFGWHEANARILGIEPAQAAAAMAGIAMIATTAAQCRRR